MGGSHRDPRCKGDANGGGVAGWLRLQTRDAVPARAGYPPPRPSPLPAAAGGGWGVRKPHFRRMTEKLAIKNIRRVSKRQIYTDTQAAG